MTKPMTIGDVMTHHPWVIGEDAPLRQARNVMVEHEIRHLPVVRHGRCVGVLTDRDIKRALDPALGLPPEDELFVRDACVFDIYTVPASEPLERVLRHLAAHHLGSAVVIDHHRPVGILTASDACRVFADFLHATAPPAFDPHPHAPGHPDAGAPRT